MCYLMTTCTVVLALSSTLAQAPRKVIVTDHGSHTSVAGPGAPRHVIGLPRVFHTITMDTGATKYGLCYTAAFDKKRPGVAIPAEGYIGMPRPSNQNWYAGGFFDLEINGKTIGATPIHSLTGRSSGNRGYVDFVFDTSMSRVRIRFITIAGSDVLYCQTLLEPKTEIKSLRVLLCCYPSAYVSNSDRHVLTPVRDIAQGKRAVLDLARELWLLYYDRIFDVGYASHSRTGVGPCAVLWSSSQTDSVSFTVGSYGARTVMNLKAQLRDFHFVFFDYAGEKNEAAMANLRQRADALLRELATFPFTDQSIANWPLAQKRKDIVQILARIPDEKETAARYQKWATELANHLKLVRSGAAGTITAEGAAAKIIQQWERGLAELKLKALLKEI